MKDYELVQESCLSFEAERELMNKEMTKLIKDQGLFSDTDEDIINNIVRDTKFVNRLQRIYNNDTIKGTHIGFPIYLFLFDHLKSILFHDINDNLGVADELLRFYKNLNYVVNYYNFAPFTKEFGDISGYHLLNEIVKQMNPSESDSKYQCDAGFCSIVLYVMLYMCIYIEKRFWDILNIYMYTYIY